MRLTERDRVLMTAEAQAALQAELEQLETVARREIAERIKTAREWGDLKENSEYHDAKNDQAHLETKILRIREQLLNAEVREVESQTEIVGLRQPRRGRGLKDRQADRVLAGLATRRGTGRGQDLVRLAGGQGAGRLPRRADGQARDATRRARADDRRYRLTKRRRESASTSVASSAGKCPP